MKVKELIEKLEKFDREKEVEFLSNGDNPVNDTGYEIGRIFEVIGAKGFEKVFLEEV